MRKQHQYFVTIVAMIAVIAVLGPTACRAAAFEKRELSAAVALELKLDEAVP